MSLSAGRVGVRADQVDAHGRVISPSFFNEIMEDLPVWTDLPVRVNGTEEVLPSNTSVPVTSPILTDIDYPDIRRNNQYFTYRESPTSVDGLAKIKSIKGNTLVWNQLVKNGNFADTSNWTTGNATFSVSSNKATLNVTNNGTVVFYQPINEKYAGHKVLVLFDGYASRSLTTTVNWGRMLGSAVSLTTTNKRFSILVPIVLGGNNNFNLSTAAETGDVINFSNVCMFDLTKMFGAGNEPSTVKEFTDLFPLSYYKYNAGSLLDFTGTKLKTTGKNLSDIGNILSTNTSYVNKSTSVLGYAIKGHTYTLSFKNLTTLTSNFKVRITPEGTNENIDQINKNLVASSKCTFTFTASDTGSIWLSGQVAGYTSVKVFEEVQLEYGSTASDYEPYEENEDELPISTFFPTGMKSAGTVYDELLPTKAITRIGAVDLGSLSWSAVNGVMKATISDSKANGECICVPYTSTTATVVNAKTEDKVVALDNISKVCVYDSAYTSASAFKTAMNGVYLYYELATPVELPTLSFE